MTRPVIVAPDPYMAVIPFLRDALDGVEVGNKMPTEEVENFVWVRRIATSADSVVIDRATLDFTVFGGKVNERVALANLVRGHLLSMDATYEGIRVFSVTEVVGPQDLPDPNVDSRTVTMFTLQFNCRATAL